jgi:hypothetical protein
MHKKPNKDIINHNRRREIEVKIAELEEELLEKGWATLRSS